MQVPDARRPLASTVFLSGAPNESRADLDLLRCSLYADVNVGDGIPPTRTNRLTG